MTFEIRRWGAALTVAAGCSFVAAAQTAAPELRPQVLNTLPQPVRASLSSAHDDVRARPDDASAVGRLAMLLHAYDQNALAGAYYTRASQLAPGETAWAYLLGVVQSEAADLSAATDSFRRALKIDSAYLPSRLRLAETLLAQGDLSASRTEYEAILRSYPEMALAHYGLGRVSVAHGDLNAAVIHYQNAVERAPQFGAAHYALALGYRDLGMGDRAARHLDAYTRFGARRPGMVDRFMEEVRSMGGTARELIVQAKRLGEGGRVADAIDLHLKALEADPTAAQAHVNLISLYGRSGRADQAEHHYKTAVQLGGNVAEAHYNFGVLLASLGRHREASEAFRRTLGADPFHPRAHHNLGALLAQSRTWEEAAHHYRQALVSDPQHHNARFGLARVLVESGRPGEAIEHLEKLLLLPAGPDAPRYRFALATACLAAGDVKKGIAHAEQAAAEAHRSGQRELADTIDRQLLAIKARLRR